MPNISNLVALGERGRAIRNSFTQKRTGHPWDAPRASRVLPIFNAPTTGRTTVRLYGAIGQSWWDDEAVTAGDLARTLDTIGPSGIDLHVNSGGGDVFDGIAMHALLLDHPSDVEVMVDGIAASAASFIAMSGDKVRVQKPAKMMVHNAAGLAWGNKKVMSEMHDLLDEIDVTIAEMYADRGDGDIAKWTAFMDAETWFSAREAVDAGLADEVANDKSAAPAAKPSKEDEPAEDAPAEEDSPEDLRTQIIRARHSVHILQRKG